MTLPGMRPRADSSKPFLPAHSRTALVSTSLFDRDDEDCLAGARQLANGFETNGWGGPCPPEGQTHRYFFELYALKTVPVVIPEKASTQDIIAAVQGAALAKTTFVASYKR